MNDNIEVETAQVADNKPIENLVNTGDVNWSKLFGYILIIPPALSVILFLYQFTGADPLDKFLSSAWTGRIGYGDSGGGGYSSALPIYMGLMAIAGAYLIKDKDK